MQGRSAKKRRSRSPKLRSTGGGISHARRGRLPHSRFVTIDSSQHRSPRSFTRFTANPSAQTSSQSQHTGCTWVDSDDPLQRDNAEQGKRPSRHQQEREQQDDQWKAQIPALAVRRICRQAYEVQRRQKLQASLCSDFHNRCQAAVRQCCHCHTAEHIQPLCPAPVITFVSIHGHVPVDTPALQCNKCGHQYTVHPFSIDCFHATPSRPEIWYDNELLEATSAAQLCGPTAIQAHCAMLQQLHRYNGFDAGKSAIWQNLSSAAEQWRRVEVHSQLL